MSKVLMLKHEGWQVATSAWSAAAKNDRTVELVYTWGQNGIGWFDSATGTARLTLDMSYSDFMGHVLAPGPVADLRRYCR